MHVYIIYIIYIYNIYNIYIYTIYIYIYCVVHVELLVNQVNVGNICNSDQKKHKSRLCASLYEANQFGDWALEGQASYSSTSEGDTFSWNLDFP